MHFAVRLYSYSYLWYWIARLVSRSVCLALGLEYIALSVLHTYDVIGGI